MTGASLQVVTYIVYRQEYSEKAGRIYGNPYVWPPVAKTRLRPPSDEAGFRSWLWHLIKDYGAGVYFVNRTGGKNERRGFHPLGYFYVDRDHIIVKRRHPEFKSHAGLPPSRQLYFKRQEERTRFRKH